MQSYVFRLDDPLSRRFRGIIAIFMTEVQEVWRRLETDDNARHVPHSVAHNEVDALRAELEVLEPGTPIERGPSLLWQLFNDPAVSADHRPTFIGQRTFPMLAQSARQSSFQYHVDRWYQGIDR